MEMGGLQRSVQTFRRSGSSGMVWDERFLSGDPSRTERDEEAAGSELRELRHSRSVGSSGTTTSTTQHRGGGGGNVVVDGSRSRQGFRAGPVSPALDPPSPDVSACALCGIFFGKRRSAKPSKPARRQ